jgi:hypothetical protein
MDGWMDWCFYVIFISHITKRMKEEEDEAEISINIEWLTSHIKHKDIMGKEKLFDGHIGH